MGLGEPQLQVVQVAVHASGGPGAILDGIRGLCLLFAIESLEAVDEGLETQAVLDIVRIAFAAERELHREVAASGPPRSLLGPCVPLSVSGPATSRKDKATAAATL